MYNPHEMFDWDWLISLTYNLQGRNLGLCEINELDQHDTTSKQLSGKAVILAWVGLVDSKANAVKFSLTADHSSHFLVTILKSKFYYREVYF